ncbi:MAG: serine/threonine-protein kinase [Bryobacteraceae bacterium]|nr:serine/threonine-protein kinase [Bryobacteraceae bacterium]
MDAERWRRIEEVFHEVLAEPHDLRAAKLEALSAGDTVVQREVESLLTAAEEQSRLSRDDAVSTDPWVGRTLGRYRLERLVGRGGMGAVYRGSRVAGDFEQTVAVKLITARLTSDWLRHGFLQERQFLALLQHPNIARLLDGGVTEGGEPFLVMEYIDGVRLDRYVEENKLSAPEIVRLFLQLCEGVSYAHRRLIVHRDLKPGNVLVTRDGVVKLLDFGTAKLLSPGEARNATVLGLRAFTPEYASPEQMFGEPVTAAADVYSLGVILYRLLTGQLPFDVAQLSSAGLVRAFFDTEPATPSSLVTRVVAGDAPQPARATLHAQIRGDLDAIVLKALRPAAAERYPSVDELALDLRRYLGHRPVAARRGSVAYRVGKFARRRAVPLAAAAVVLVSTVAGVSSTVRQARIAAAEEQRANAAFQDVRRLSHMLIGDFFDTVSQLPGSMEVQRRLVRESIGYLDGLSREAGDNPEVQLDLLDAYTKLGGTQGSPYMANLGDPKGALESLARASAIASRLEQSPPGLPALRRIAALRRTQSDIYFGMGRTAEALQYSRQSAAAYEKLLALPGVTAEDYLEAGSTYETIGDQLGLHGAAGAGDTAGALAAYRRTGECRLRALELAPGHPRASRGYVILQMKVANLHAETEPHVARRIYEDALRAWDGMPREVRDTIVARRVRGLICVRLGRLLPEIDEAAAALPHLDRAREVFRSLIPLDPNDARLKYDLATADFYEAEALRALNRKTEALRSYTAVAETLGKLLEQVPDNLVWQSHRAQALFEAGRLERELGRRERGSELLRRGLDLLVRVARNPAASPNDLHRAAGDLLTAKSGVEQALGFAQSAVEKTGGKNAVYLLTLARAQQQVGQREAALETARRALQLLPQPKAGEPAAPLRQSLEQLLHQLPQQQQQQ